jgi:GWxTD domain-containing protein
MGVFTKGAAQTEFSGIPEPGVPVFDLDLAAFRESPDSARVEIYYRITNPRLSYIRKDERYVASYEITAILKGKNDQQAANVSNRENYALDSFEETRRGSGFLINVLPVVVAAGEYDAIVTLNDRISGGTHTLTRHVDLRRLGERQWVIGGPEYFMPGVPAPDQDRFRQGEIALVPNVARSYINTDDRLAIYFEIYQSAERHISQVVIEALQRSPSRQFADTIEVAGDADIHPIVYRNPLARFHLGETRLVLKAIDARGSQVGDAIESQFAIEWTVQGMVEIDWDLAVDMLVHIAETDELDSLHATPKEERQRVFDEFWKSKDPTPETDENEWKDEYYRRIRFANQQYSNPFRPGWRTDFGTVYIKYGEPDDVERYPFELEQKPHEVWYYYAQRRQFLFIDVRGNGEYELQYPYDGIIR